MQKSTIKNTLVDCLRVIYRRKTLIILPVLGIACCFAFYSFCIADEIYQTENSLLVLDNKTGKPLLNDPTTTSELSRRVERSVGRVVSRSGTFALIAGVEQLANQFPDSEILQSRRLEVLREKQLVLDHRIQTLERRKTSLNNELCANGTADSQTHPLVIARLRELIDIGVALDRRKRELEEAIALADRRLGEIRREAASFESMGFAFESGRVDDVSVAEYNDYLARRDATNCRLDEFAECFEKNLTLRFGGGTVVAAYESADPLICRDVVDEVLYRVECESIEVTRNEIRNNGEALAQCYDKSLTRQKELKAKIHSFKEKMNTVPEFASCAAHNSESGEPASRVKPVAHETGNGEISGATDVKRERNPYYDDLANKLAVAQKELRTVEQDVRICALRLDGRDESALPLPQIANVRGIRFEKNAPTSVPLAPYKPNRRAMILFGLALGIVVATLMVVVVESADRTIRSRRDVTSTLGLPLLGSVPMFERHCGGVRSVRRLTARFVFVGCVVLAMVAGLTIALVRDGNTSLSSEKSTTVQDRTNAEDRAMALPLLEPSLAPDQNETQSHADSAPASSTTIMPVFESDAEPDAPQHKEAADD